MGLSQRACNTWLAGCNRTVAAAYERDAARATRFSRDLSGDVLGSRFRTVLVDAPQCLAGEVTHGGIAVDGHDQVSFGEQRAQYVHDTVGSS